MDTIGPVSASLPRPVDEEGYGPLRRAPAEEIPLPRARSVAGSIPLPRGSAPDEVAGPQRSRGPESAPEAMEASNAPPHGDRAEEAAGPADPEILREAARSIQEQLTELGQHDLEIRYDEEVSRYVVRFLDVETREEIRQIPPEQLLEASRRLGELRGLLFDEKS